MYKLLLKDSTVFNLKSIEEDTEMCMKIVLDTELSHDNAISKFTKDNLQYVKIISDEIVLNTYVNISSVAESSVKNGEISIKLNKYDTKDIVINLRKENEYFKETILQCNKSILDLSDIILSLSLKNN